MKRGWLLVGVLLALAGTNAVRSAPPRLGLAVEGGISPRRDVDVRRLNIRSPWGIEGLLAGAWRVRLGGEGAVGEIRARYSSPNRHSSLTEVSLRAVVRASLGRKIPWFIDGGTGPVHLSDRVIGQLDLGSRIQFRSHIGAGAFFGPSTGWWIGYRYSHTSNADLGSPNPGINFHLLQLGHSFGGPW